MCGEKSRKMHGCTAITGTSPRVWGKAGQAARASAPARNIPTCVGKRCRCKPRPPSGSEHPHVCGEKFFWKRVRLSRNGTSPRVWGKVGWLWLPVLVTRNIPTCVGKSNQRRGLDNRKPEHPHVCGEKIASMRRNGRSCGTSPRVWGKAGETI